MQNPRAAPGQTESSQAGSVLETLQTGLDFNTACPILHILFHSKILCATLYKKQTLNLNSLTVTQVKDTTSTSAANPQRATESSYLTV